MLGGGGGGGGGGGSVPCTHRRMLRDTYPYTAMSSEGDIH